MAFEQPCLTITVPASGDLSASQYKFVKLNTSGQAVIPTGATDAAIGVLQNKPTASGAAAEVMILGISKVQGDANLAKADFVGTSADGQAAAYTAADTTKHILGIVLDDNAAAAGYASVLLLGPGRTLA